MTSPKTYRAVLVGTGSIADAHVRAVEATRGRVVLVAAVDLNAKRVADFGTRFHLPETFTDYDVMLRTVRPDLVLLATPPASHTAMSIAAMEAGAWVLCEKPFCGSLAELDAIEAAEKRTGRYTACVFQMRFASSTAHLRDLADAGQLGRPLVAGPGVPAERVAALRRAFDLTVKDPAYLAELTKINLPLNAMGGEELQKVVTDMVNTPKPIVERLIKAIEGRDVKELAKDDATKGGAK